MSTIDSDQFAQAIANRFGNTHSMLTARLAPPSPVVSHPPPSPPSAFDPVLPTGIDSWLADNTALIIDIRPHAAYASARIPHAISLSVPSTLLKRPLFSLQRLSEMLHSSAARNRFSAWQTASNILVYDADSHAVGDSSNIAGLLKKFKTEGFTGDLKWLQGGFQAVWRERRDIVDTHPPSPDPSDHDDDSDDKSPHILRTRHLPLAAFSLPSTVVHASAGPISASGSKSQSSLLPPTSALPQVAINPFFDTIRQNIELSHGITERIPLRLSRRVRHRIHELPFPWLREIARRSAVAPPGSSDSDDSSEDDDPNPTDVEEGQEALAMQFYKIEVAEQRRLMGIMEHHSKESMAIESSASSQRPMFPFSITAGFEKGTKNRYRHIWPFEHARVRLHQTSGGKDDYVNASYVQPLGTSKKYIATQGPLPATFNDFWTLCWEQNVHVIVMLTREVEGAMVKCGSYWTDTEYGPLRLRLVSTEGVPVTDDRPTTAHPLFQHPPPPPQASRPPSRHVPHSAGSQRRYRHHRDPTIRSETVKRVFELSHTQFPDASPRKIVHLQFLEWPDMNVPDDPRGVLGLIKLVEEAVRETRSADPVVEPSPSKNTISSTSQLDDKTGISKAALGDNNPILLHCSAGVGRTGGFIAVDAVLDSIRREVRKAYEKPSSHPHQSMDLDLAPSSQPSQPAVGGAKSHDGPDPFAHVFGELPMQVDSVVSEPPETSGSEPEGPHVQSVSSTLRWRQHVDAATHIIPANPSQGSLDSSQVSGSSSMEGFIGTHGTFHHSSSSFGTSISASSPPLVKDSPHLSTHRPPCTPPPSISLPVGQDNAMQVSPLPNDRMEVSPLPRRRLGLKLKLSSSTQSTSETEPSPPAISPPIEETNSILSHPQARPLPAPVARLPRLSNPAPLSPGRKAFDYKEPRCLSQSGDRIPLSKFEAPILEVVQDMREQRMSLCQSLRQYVFVHAAVIEGALMVLDEEKEYAAGLRPRPPSNNTRSSPSLSPDSAHLPPGTSSLSLALSSNDTSLDRLPTNKRCASPTELSKEDKAGETIVPKRPSIKRKERSGEDQLAHDARYHPMPARPSITISTSAINGFSSTR